MNYLQIQYFVKLCDGKFWHSYEWYIFDQNNSGIPFKYTGERKLFKF